MKTSYKCVVLICFLPLVQPKAQTTDMDYYSPIVEWQQPSGFEVTSGYNRP